MCYSAHIIYCKFAGPPALRMNIMKNIECSSIVVQWDEVNDSLPTTYIITWTVGNLYGYATIEEQTSHTIAGLTLDTVYTITVSAANRCGDVEVTTSVSLSTNTTSTTPSTSPTIIVSTNTTNPSSTTSTNLLITTTTTGITTHDATTAATTVVKTSATSTYAPATNAIVSTTPTGNPADTTTADECSKN